MFNKQIRTYCSLVCLSFMFSFFKKKSKKEVLQEEHRKLLEEAFKMSSINRTKSDELVAKASEIERQIEEIKE